MGGWDVIHIYLPCELKFYNTSFLPTLEFGKLILVVGVSRVTSYMPVMYLPFDMTTSKSVMESRIV